MNLNYTGRSGDLVGHNSFTCLIFKEMVSYYYVYLRCFEYEIKIHLPFIKCCYLFNNPMCPFMGSCIIFLHWNVRWQRNRYETGPRDFKILTIMMYHLHPLWEKLKKCHNMPRSLLDIAACKCVLFTFITPEQNVGSVYVLILDVWMFEDNKKEKLGLKCDIWIRAGLQLWLDIFYKLHSEISRGFCVSVSEVLEFPISNSKVMLCSLHNSKMRL